ncbi:MAG: serine hydrolase [Verrucomicrobia bacterium]|nr:serine hydrolase [Verrucomicrobiota bacterium]MDA1069774.1 serine hydrolase [Verrucomicrobiota bacterium]
MSSQAILDFIQSCEEETDAVHSFMIHRHGKLVSEGWWSPHGPDTTHIMHSMSKAFTSTAAGIAIGEGLFSLDDKVISLFPEKAPEKPSRNLSNLRIRQLITMSTGHQFKVSFYERCVLMTVTLRFESEVAIIDVDTNVVYFDEPYPQLVGVKVEK